MKWILPIALFATCACSPQKRLDRLVKHHPELLRSDTVTVHDTVRPQPVKGDTVVKPKIVNGFPQNAAEANDLVKRIRSLYGDSIEVEQNGIITKVIFRDNGDVQIKTVYVPKPVIKAVRVPLVKYQILKEQITWQDRWVWILLGALIGAALVFFLTLYFVLWRSKKESGR